MLDCVIEVVPSVQESRWESVRTGQVKCVGSYKILRQALRAFIMPR